MTKKKLQKITLKKKKNSVILLYTNGSEDCCHGDIHCCNSK